ncbi:hypothetical protein Tco_0487172 [Tanacetum coccineum]
MSNRHQELASPKQTALYCTKALATPEQTATGKEIPNPFIADSLLKTIRSDEMLLKIKSQTLLVSFLIINSVNQCFIVVALDLSKVTNPLQAKGSRSIQKSSFAKPYDMNTPGPSKNSLKHVSFQSPRESVGSNDMVHNYYLEEAKKKAQLQKDKALNTKPSVQQSARLPNTANGNKPKPRNFNQQPRNWPPSMSSRVSNRTVNIAEPPRNQKTFLKSKDLACPTCKKCIYSANHDECILKYLSKVNSRASAQKKDAQSHKTTKRYIPVEKKSDSKNHGRQIPIGQRFSPNKSSNVYLKTTPPRSGLTWKPTGRIFTQVGLKWIPIRKLYGGGGIPFQLKSYSLPHAHAQTTKTYYKHHDSRIKKAQELKTKTSANSNINSSETKLRGRLLESFQEDAKYEHVGQDTRSQNGKDDQD